MIHPLVWWGFNQVFRFILKFPTAVDDRGFIVVVYDNPYLALIIASLGTGITLFLSHLSYQFIEMKFNSFKIRFSLYDIRSFQSKTKKTSIE